MEALTPFEREDEELYLALQQQEIEPVVRNKTNLTIRCIILVLSSPLWVLAYYLYTIADGLSWLDEQLDRLIEESFNYESD